MWCRKKNDYESEEKSDDEPMNDVATPFIHELIISRVMNAKYVLRVVALASCAFREVYPS
jgi:hypothetical protein